MLQLTFPDEVYNCIRDVFNSHSHCTRFAGEVSSLAGITANVVQGSSLGPASYIVNAADLRPKHGGNVITKFADDTYLIIPARNSYTRGNEVSHVKSWASNNNLQLNLSKSHEIVFRSRRLRGKADQPAPSNMLTNLQSSASSSTTVLWLPTTSAVYLLPVQVYCTTSEYSDVMASVTSH